jgi:hypothetical protein
LKKRRDYIWLAYLSQHLPEKKNIRICRVQNEKTFCPGFLPTKKGAFED